MQDDDPTTTTSLDEVPTARAGAAFRILGDAKSDVVLAHDDRLGRTVAIKRMPDAAPSERAVHRFLREARIQGRLDHPAIVPVYEIGRNTEGRPYFAMKQVAGATLRAVLAAGTLPRQRLLRAFADVCLAIDLAHGRGVVHRNLTPDSVVLGDFGEAYVVDWSRARLAGETDDVAVAATPYAAPEQLRDPSAVDGRADVYALGCILSELVAGEAVPELDAVCARATAQNRDHRLASARELGAHVQRYVDGDRDVARRRELAAAHLAAAREAFERGDPQAALHDGARAMALDPALREAAELVARIMIEPPPEMPPEIAAAVARDDLAISRRTTRFVAIANFGFLAFVPLLLVAGKSHPVAIGAMCVLVAANATLLAWSMRGGSVTARWLRLVINVLMTALIARIASPFLLGPGLAAVTVVGLVAGTFHTNRDVVIAGLALIASVLVPWFAEVAGWLSPTMTVAGSHIVIESALLMDRTAIYAGLVLFTIVIVLVASMLTRGVRIAESAARMQLHLQAWQLRQLVPSA